MQRREFVDWARGFAVLAMVVWHTADGWLRADVRSGQVWVLLRFVGGLAAPSFLFLAGVGLALSTRPEPRPAPPVAASAFGEDARSTGAERRRTSAARSLARGLEIVLFGYVLRFQTWMIDAAAVKQLGLMRAWFPLGAGYALLFLSLQALKAEARRARRLALLGALAVAIGLAQVPWVAPGRLPRLLQVDVLQAIGASLILLGFAERSIQLLQRPTLAVGVGTALALATEFVGSALPGPLPVPLAAYFGRFAASPGLPAPSLFPLLPWASYACFGAAFGGCLRASRAREPAAPSARQQGQGTDERFLVLTGVGGALVALATSEAHEFMREIMAAHPWTIPPLRVAFRTALVLVLLLVGWLWASHGRGRLLIAYGRTSLRIYWAHLLVAYGVLGTPWSKRLGVGEWAARVVLVLAFMWVLSQLKSRAPAPLGNSPSHTPTPVSLPPRRGRLP